MLKRKKLRHNEYYDRQNYFDNLYAQSVNGQNFYKLMKWISSDENIRLAYRNIKRNTGSKTAGTDKLTIKDVKYLSVEEVIQKVQNMLQSYEPQEVRRVFISKTNGKVRPLGIPTIWDRILQQSILQVLEPICEAKFHKHSYAWGANRCVQQDIVLKIFNIRALFLSNEKSQFLSIKIEKLGFFLLESP